MSTTLPAPKARRTNAEKRQDVLAYLNNPACEGWSDHVIGDLCGVDSTTVGRIRAELSDGKPQSTIRVGRDGRRIDTARIGRTRRRTTAAKHESGVPQAFSLSVQDVPRLKETTEKPQSERPDVALPEDQPEVSLATPGDLWAAVFGGETSPGRSPSTLAPAARKTAPVPEARYQGGLAYCCYCYKTHAHWTDSKVRSVLGNVVWQCDHCQQKTGDAVMQLVKARYQPGMKARCKACCAINHHVRGISDNWRASERDPLVWVCPLCGRRKHDSLMQIVAEPPAPGATEVDVDTSAKDEDIRRAVEVLGAASDFLIAVQGRAAAYLEQQPAAKQNMEKLLALVLRNDLSDGTRVNGV